MGYGGRLLGAIAAGVNYIGTDPCIPTYDGLVQIQKDYAHKHLNYSLQRIGSETFIPEDESIDFVFTSPPTLVGKHMVMNQNNQVLSFLQVICGKKSF